MKKDKKEQNWIVCLLSYASECRMRIAASVFLSVISVVSGLIPFYCVYRMISLYVENTLSIQAILLWCGIAAAAYLVKVMFFSVSTMLSHYAAYHVLEKLRIRVIDRLLRAPLGEVMAHSIGEIKGIMVDKIEDIEPPLAHIIPEGSGHLVLPIVSLFALAVIDWRVALASLVTVPLSMVCMMLTFSISGKNFDKYENSNNHMNSAVVEYVEGIEVIKAFGRAGISYEKFSNAITDYREFVLKWLSSTWITMKLSFALFPSTLLGTLPVSLALAINGTISPPEAALCVMLSISMVGSLAKLEVFSNSLRQIKATVDRLQEFLEMPTLLEPRRNTKLNNYSICIENMRFSYTGKKEDEVIHGINLTISQGNFVALVGPSGGGKSTVAKLIARFWDVSSGKITIGDIDIKDIPLMQLADTVSFVAQDNFLFRCSLKENIRLGNPKASDEEVHAAAKAAQCDEFISKLPLGYDTPAGEAGKKLSGGEKQRIAIARMILKNAPIIILDEATAFTDPENEEKLQLSISELTHGKTLMVIAHRLSTIRHADKIVVLEKGGIAAQGNHEQLLEGCELYRNMWQAHIGARKWAAGKEKITHV